MARTKTSAGKRKPATAGRKTAGRKTAGRKPSAGRQAAGQQLPAPSASNNDVAYFINTITQLYQFFVQEHQTDSALTGEERRRLLGAGVRNYGFIEKSLDVVRDNPGLFPTNFNIARFALNVHELDVYRQLFWVLEKFTQAANESMLINANASMQDALRVYRILKELTRSKVRGAEPLFRALARFFARPRHPEQGDQPTIDELERDFDRVVHGKAEGKVAAEAVMPRVSVGKRKVLDEVRAGRAALKETGDVEYKE